MRDLLRRPLRRNSEKALRTAIDVSEVDGVGGILIGRIPEDSSQPVEFIFTTGRAEIVLR